jgi:hypothetical protein
LEQNVLDERPLPVKTRFELAAARMMEEWAAAGSVQVSAADMRLAREFLEHAGWRVEDGPGLNVRMTRHGRVQELTREAAFMIALRRLANHHQNLAA